MLTITSPNFPDNYPSDYLCLYSIPVCPDEKDIYYISWTKDNFRLEDAGDYVFLKDICTDLVELTTPSDPGKLELGGARLEDPFQMKTLCGDQGDFNDTSAGHGLFVSTFCLWNLQLENFCEWEANQIFCDFRRKDCMHGVLEGALLKF